MNFFPPLLELNFYSLTKEQFSRRLLNNSDKKISNYRCRALVSCVPHLLLLLQLDIVFHVSGFLLNQHHNMDVAHVVMLPTDSIQTHIRL